MLDPKEDVRVLVFNCGSSSLKYEVFRMPHRQSLGRGLVERIGEDGGRLTQQAGGLELLRKGTIPDHTAAMSMVGRALTDPEAPVVQELGDVHGIGHRVVHGGEHFSASVVIDDPVVRAIEESAELAPLHNPANLTGIHEAALLLPGVKQVAVFDTAFHQTMPPSAYLYAIPREFYEKHRIRRYGFHGTSHRYVAARAHELLRRVPDNTNLITCHLGNGASVTAIEHGRSIDTTMGFTPLEGLAMGTRSGDIDPAILGYMEQRGYTTAQLLNVLNKKSGLLGLSGISNDLRDLEAAVDAGDPRAGEALDVYAHKVRKYIGAYAAELVKVDGLVFTGGIGQHGVRMRERICTRLEHLGIVMDYGLNGQNGSREGLVSTPWSRTSILVVPTNEELQIAMDTYLLLFPFHAGRRQRSTDVNL